MAEDYERNIPVVYGALKQVFGRIAQYHKALGYPPRNANQDTQDKINIHRDLCLALHEEVSEILRAAPWKPWRPEGYRDIDEENFIEEVVDVIFFLSSILENWDISLTRVAETFDRKMAENYKRIETGYNS